jgi:hypothetical protein
MANMPIPDHLAELLARFANVQRKPVTDPALIKRMKTEATTWINAVHMQYHRISRPLASPSDGAVQYWRQEIDLHFLLVALTRLRRAVVLAARISQLQRTLNDRVADFDRDVPYLLRLRNVAEHVDDYTTGRGRDRRVMRWQLQNWSFGSDQDGNVTWSWLGEQVNPAKGRLAAVNLYRSFLAEVERYLSTFQNQES